MEQRMELRVRIRRLRDGIAMPAYETAGAAAFDLAAAADVTVEPGTVRLVPTGLVIEVPAGMFLGIFARSSTPLKRGLMVANGVGIVDADYCGPADEVKIAVVEFHGRGGPDQDRRPNRAGHAAAAPRVTWEEVTELGAESRGRVWRTGN